MTITRFTRFKDARFILLFFVLACVPHCQAQDKPVTATVEPVWSGDTTSTTKAKESTIHDTDSKYEFKAVLQSWSGKPVSGISLKLYVFADTQNVKSTDNKLVLAKTLTADSVNVGQTGSGTVDLGKITFKKSRTDIAATAKTPSSVVKSGQVYYGWVLEVLVDGKIIDTVFSSTTGDLQKAYESSAGK
ncbi:MAG: hypothetical protein PHD76_09215 [Methylacidiphilales bacterium]|nr:hypothetical protein [Candidatus Methylacidiphilales bacterium]